MSEAVDFKSYITPVGRISFPHLFEKNEQMNGDMKYDCAYLIPKDDEKGIKDIKRHIRAAIVSKWGEDKKKWPKGMDIPLRDGDERADKAKEDGKNLETYRDHMYMNCKSDYAPGVVGPNAKPLMNQDDIYAGCYVRLDISFFAFTKGDKGVGVGLNNVMLVKQSEDRWDGRRNPESAFADYATDDDLGDEPEKEEKEEADVDDLEDFD